MGGRGFLAGLALWLLAGLSPVRAADLPGLDINAIPMDLHRTAAQDCGVSVAQDPAWSREVERDKTKSGKPRTKYSFNDNLEAHKRDARYGAKVVVKPMLFFSVRCWPTSLSSHAELEAYAKTEAKRLGALTGRSLKPLQRITLPGIGTAFTLVGQIKNPDSKRVSDVGHLFAVWQGKAVKLRVSVSRSPGGSFVIRHRAGKEIRLTGKPGEPDMVFRSVNESRQNPDGLFAYWRTGSENLAVIRTLLGALRPLDG